MTADWSAQDRGGESYLGTWDDGTWAVVAEGRPGVFQWGIFTTEDDFMNAIDLGESDTEAVAKEQAAKALSIIRSGA
jgi:hypothetical protein